MTSKELANLAYPYVKKCLLESKDLGFFWKTLSRPAWFTLTRIGIEIAVALTKPKVEPILKYLIDLFPIIPDKYLPGIDKNFVMAFLELLQTPKENMLKVVQDNLGLDIRINEFNSKQEKVHTMTPQDWREVGRILENYTNNEGGRP